MTEDRVDAGMVVGGRTIAEPRLSAGGAVVAFVSVSRGRGALMVVDAAGGPERILAVDPEPATRGGVFDWRPDGTALVYAGRRGGLWKVASGGGPPVALIPDDVAVEGVAAGRQHIAFVVDQREIWTVSVDGGRPTLIDASHDFAFDPAWTGDDLRWQAWDDPSMPWDESVIVRATPAGDPSVLFARAGFQVQQPRGDAVLCDQNGWLNLWSLSRGHALLAEHFEHGGPSWGMGQRSFAWAPDGARIAFTRNENGFGRLCVLDLATMQVREVARAVHDWLSWCGDRLAAVRTGGRTPTQLVVYDTATWARRTVAFGPVAGFESVLVEPDLVTWPAGDGFVVHGRLYRPAAVTGAGPLLVWVHGGPTDQWPVRFMARVAWALDRGWSVLVPDPRGSTGHGRAYAQALYGRWGELDTSDVAAGIDAAIARGWTVPGWVVTIGASAGGLTALGVVASRPDVVAGAIAAYPVTNPAALAEVTHRFEVHYTARLCAPEPIDLLTIKSPCLILQGSDDPVVPVEQTRAFVAALQARGAPVDYHEYDGEGHGWRRPETTEDELTRMGDLLAGLGSPP